VKPKIICVMGPTASGKTDLAITLANAFPMQIINVDSALVYRDMNIGTAKPSAKELAKAPHRLINLCDPSEAYSAGRFREEALLEIQTILDAGKIPLLVGGTMLYFRVLQFGVADLPEADPHIREQIEKRAQEKGWPALHEALAKIDEQSAKQIHPNDSQRIARALEVFQITGRALSELHAQQQQQQAPFEFINIAIAPEDRKVLHERIERRFKSMLDNGFIDEVKALYERGDLHADLPAMRTVGYRQVWDYLDGKSDYETMVHKGIVATRQLARRQLIWLRRWPDVTWFNSVSTDLNQDVVAFLKERLADETGNLH